MGSLKKGVLSKRLYTLLLVICCIPLSIFATSTDKKLEARKESIYYINIHPSGNGSLQQITLTEDIYLHSKDRQLNDLLVLDRLGAELPFEINTPENKVLQYKKEVAIYPIHEQKHLLKQTDSVSFKYDQENRLSEIQKVNGADKQSQVVGYLLDLGEEIMAGTIFLNFDLSRVSQTSFLRFDIDQSDNLKNWNTVSRGDVLAQLLDRKKLTQHNEISLSRVYSRYLRINLLDKSPMFSINSVVLKYTEKTKTQLVWGEQKEINFSDIEQAFIINTSPSLAYRTIQLNLSDSTTLLRGNLYSKNGEQENWIFRHHLNFFHIKDGEKYIVKDRLSLPGLRASQIKIEFDNVTEAQRLAPLELKLAWSPQQLTFVANGNKPYDIAVGKHRSSNTPIDLLKAQNHKMITVIKDEIVGSIKEAKFGESRLVVIEPVAESYVNWKKISLWFVLIVGVFLMAWMAKRLLKQVD